MVTTLEEIVTGDTVNFKLTITKDGSAWNLTGGAVTLYLRDPSGAVTSYAASLTDPTSGIAAYVTATSVLATAGTWARSWLVVVSGVQKRTRFREFKVHNP